MFGLFLGRAESVSGSAWQDNWGVGVKATFDLETAQNGVTQILPDMPERY